MGKPVVVDRHGLPPAVGVEFDVGFRESGLNSVSPLPVGGWKVPHGNVVALD